MSVKPRGGPSKSDPLALLRAKVQTLRRQVPDLADEEVWRPFLARHAGGETSTRAMGERQLKAVVEALHAAGAPRTAARSTGRKMPYKEAPQMAKARALWIALAEAGTVRDRTDKALAAYIRRQTGQDIGAVPPAGWNKVIEGLKAWGARKGVEPE